MRRLKNFFAVILALILAVSILGSSADVYAASSSKPSIRKTQYEGGGNVSVTFKESVEYKNLKITVTNSDGDTYTARTTSKSKRELNFRASKIKANGKYKFKISGVKVKNGRYTSVSGTFRADDFKNSSSSGKTLSAKVKYMGNNEVKLTFAKKVKYNDVAIKMKDSSGKSYKVKITDKDSGSLTFKADSLKAGKTYSATISGIKYSGDSKYTKIVCKFDTEKEEESVSFKKFSYDADSGKLTIYFNEQVKFKDEKISIKDSGGKKYTAKILDTAKDRIEVRVRNLKVGEKYSLTLSGVRSRTGNDYTKVKGTFKY